MVRVPCIKPDCPSPTKTFEWDETRYVSPGGGIAAPNAPGAKSVIATCPYCGTECKVWVTHLKRDDTITRE